MAINRHRRKILDFIYKCKENRREKIDPVRLEFGGWLESGRVEAEHCCNDLWDFEFELYL